MLVVFIIGIAASSSQSFESAASEREYTTIYGDPDTRHTLLSIPIKGPIEGDQSSEGYDSIFADPNVAYGYDLKSELIDAANSRDYDGVVLEIDSPGGTIFGSKAISDGVAYYKKTTKQPVFVHVQGLAASGAFWAAVSADKIIADSGTGIGSIGVIYGPFTYFDKPVALDGGLLGGGVITQNGIEQTYITAGEGKDAGNPFRRLTAKEQAVIQQGVNDSYEQFVSYVADRRKISSSVIQTDIGAHLYGEKQALTHGLIDEIGSREVAYHELALLAGVAGRYHVVSSHEASSDFWSRLGAQLPSKEQKTDSSTSSGNPNALVCRGAVAVPLAFYGQPASACKK